MSISTKVEPESSLNQVKQQFYDAFTKSAKTIEDIEELRDKLDVIAEATFAPKFREKEVALKERTIQLLQDTKAKLNQHFYSKFHPQTDKHPESLLTKINEEITTDNTITIGYPVQPIGQRQQIGKKVRNIQVKLDNSQSIAFIDHLTSKVEPENIGIKIIPNVIDDKTGLMRTLFNREAARLAEIRQAGNTYVAIKSINLVDSCKDAVVNHINTKEAIILLSEKTARTDLSQTDITEPVLSFIFDNTGYILVEDCGTSISNPIATGTQVQAIPRGLNIDFNIFMTQIVTSIHKLHETSKIYHLDIKPNNIVKCGETYKLIDFGVSLNIPNLQTTFTEDEVINAMVDELQLLRQIDKAQKKTTPETTPEPTPELKQYATDLYVKYFIPFQGTMSYFSPAYYALTDLEYNLSLKGAQREQPGNIHEPTQYHINIRLSTSIDDNIKKLRQLQQIQKTPDLHTLGKNFINTAYATARSIIPAGITAKQKSNVSLIRQILIQQDWFALGLTILDLFKERAFNIDSLSNKTINKGLQKLASVTTSTENTAADILAAFGIAPVVAMRAATPRILSSASREAVLVPTAASKQQPGTSAAARRLREAQKYASKQPIQPAASSKSGVPNLPPVRGATKQGGASEYKLTDYKAALPNQTRLRKVYKYMKKYYVKSKGEWIAVKVRPMTAPK